MKKLALKLEHLEVESFDTTRPEDTRGTVLAHATVHPEATCFETCDLNRQTCQNSCGWATCFENTCQYSCGLNPTCNVTGCIHCIE